MTYDASSVLITGASQGIGRVIAVTFAGQAGRPLILLSRSKKKLEETKKLCEKAGENKVLTLACDATNYKEVTALELPGGFPAPGILINNAGGFLFKKLEDTSDEEFEGQIRLNLFAAVNTIKRFLPDLKQLERGLIINICSMASLTGYGKSGAYAASKHAILGYTRSLRKELMKTNIGVTAINLGQTYSTSWEKSDVDPGRLIDPKDLAGLLLALTRLSSRTVAEEINLKPQGGAV